MSYHFGLQIGGDFVTVAAYSSMVQLLFDRPGLRMNSKGQLVWARDFDVNRKGDVAAVALWIDDTEQENEE